MTKYFPKVSKMDLYKAGERLKTFLVSSFNCSYLEKLVLFFREAANSSRAKRSSVKVFLYLVISS